MSRRPAPTGKSSTSGINMRTPASALSIAAVAAFGLAACGGSSDSNAPPASSAGTFKETVLVSDGSVAAPHTDPNLKNGWGVAFNPTGAFWVADNNTQKSTLYDGNGVVQSLVVTIPPAASGKLASPTGMLFNSTPDFAITANGATSNAVFMWATLAGTIAAWSPKVLPTVAVTVHDDGAGAAEYTGLTIASNAGASTLYAADFHNGKVDMFDKTFTKLSIPGAFTDPTIPAGINPFGIQAIGDTIFVSYAKLGPDGLKQQNGPGNGVVDAYDLSGHLLRRITSGGVLNSPWGMAMAPANFGAVSNDLLVGNFGDGTVNAFDPNTGASKGALMQADGTKVTQPGIWGIEFGNDVDNQPSNTLFFAAGPTPTTGIFGRIDSSQ
jgi:uncharacterized protein (TIGR03118 family)